MGQGEGIEFAIQDFTISQPHKELARRSIACLKSRETTVHAPMGVLYCGVALLVLLTLIDELFDMYNGCVE